MKSITQRLVSAGLAAAMALTMTAACSSDDSAGEAKQSDEQARLVKADVERTAAPADAPVDQVVAGLRKFAVELAGTQPDGNLVVSPTSIAVAFAMAEAGADEATAAQIAQTFGFPDQPGVHQAMNSLIAQFDHANVASEDPDEELELDLANAVWGQKGTSFGQAFLETLARDYGTGVETTDFADDPDGSRKAINSWVSDVTRDRIPELVPDGMITPQTLVMLVNAIYLKAAWETKFDADSTADEPFHLADGSSVDLPMMHESDLPTTAARGDGYTAVEIPYVGGDVSMLVMLPDEGTSLAQFEAGLSGDRLGQITGSLQDYTVELSLPRWETDTALDLAVPLGKLGLPIPGGNLSGIAAGVGIGAAVHAANITVDETGTEAAAATAVVGVASAAPGEILTVKVDRPFVYVIQHKPSGAPLFYGRVTDPRG